MRARPCECRKLLHPYLCLQFWIYRNPLKFWYFCLNPFEFWYLRMAGTSFVLATAVMTAKYVEQSSHQGERNGSAYNSTGDGAHICLAIIAIWVSRGSWSRRQRTRRSL